MDSDRFQRFLYYRFLLAVDGVGPVRVRNLLAVFAHPEDFYSSSSKQVSDIDGFSAELASRFRSSLNLLPDLEERLKKEIDELRNIGAGVLLFGDDEYPVLLQKIYDPPFVLYYRGSLDYLNKDLVAVVGTREPTRYGTKITNDLVKQLCASDIVIVSGLARGIDSAAHCASVEANAPTIAVMGTGLDIVYPSENKELAKRIESNGVLLSEYPAGTKPEAMNFPRRNRIISGLSKAVIIVETAVKGGAMLTAEFALDQGRDVYAVPGNLGSRTSEGTNRLIRSGEAKMLLSPIDVLEDLGLTPDAKMVNNERQANIESLNLFEQQLFNVLGEDTLSIDKISADAKLPVSDCLVHLLSLEFKGLIRQLPGKMFVRL